MSTIEEKFFKTFGILPRSLSYPDNFQYYPEITDAVLLQLICVYLSLPDIDIFLKIPSVKELKEDVLFTLMERSEQKINLDNEITVSMAVKKIFKEVK